MSADLSQAKLSSQAGLPQWYFAESLECCEKYKREADAVKPPEKSDLIQLSLMEDEIAYLAQCIRRAKTDQEQREVTQAMKKLCVEQSRVETEQKKTLEQRQIEYLHIQQEIFERYVCEREAINSKLTALIYDKCFAASLICREMGASESAELALGKSLVASPSAKTNRQKRQTPADCANKITKRRCSSQQQTSYFNYDSDSSQEEHH